MPLLILLYATSPVMAVVGCCQATRILRTAPEKLWRLTAKGGGIPRDFFFSYFAATTEGCAIEVHHPMAFGEPVSLSSIREYDARYRPPQSMEYVDGEHPVALALSDHELWPPGTRK